MHMSLFWKLFAVQVLAAVTLLAGALLVVRQQTASSFSVYVEARERQRMEDVAERIAEQYAKTPDLRRAAESARELRRRPRPWPPDERRDGARADGNLVPRVPPLRAPLTVFDANGARVAGPPLPPLHREPLRVPIESGGAVVGHVVRPPVPNWIAPDEAGFAQRQSRSLLRIGLLGLPVAALFAALSSALILRPIRQLSDGAAALSRREFATRIDTRRRDELGRLAADFNRLAEALQRYDDRQRQWLADIAHELRTPIAVLRGELEALVDGVRAPEPQRLRSLQQEVLRLAALVDDLHLLSVAESGALRLQREPVDPATLLREAQARFDARLRAAGFAVELDAGAGLPAIAVDAQRIAQVLGNLLENVLRHAQPPGPLRLSVAVAADGVRYSICDAGPGVPADALPRLFDRLYRAESARSRADGGAGLGLAICRSIVEAHGGSIHAEVAPGGGLCIRFDLPQVSP
ncbi:ATP-binding protein [Fontimonas sp. SYSU GA230001]|uniref:ATP-binding protein n=1 Tax=Fontimonas sp. SYSU GA230001 TaxID=3142450 RepID=UPI0032B5E073